MRFGKLIIMKQIMKLMTLIGILFIISVVPTGHLFAQKSGLSIGVVDVETIVKELPEAIEADRILKDMQKNSNDSLVKLQEDFMKKVDQYKKQKAMMQLDAQQKEEEKLQSEEQSLMQLRDLLLGNVSKKREEFLEPIRNKVKVAIEAVAKEEKINLVLDKGNAVLLYSEDQFDITYKVLDRIKRGSKTK